MSASLAFAGYSLGSPFSAEEAARKQPEWEKEIQTLDREEKQLHQAQLKLMREQTAVFLRDLAALQGEITALKASQKRMDRFEQALQELTENHTRGFDLIKDAHGRLVEDSASQVSLLAKRVDSIEKVSREANTQIAYLREQANQVHGQHLDKLMEFLGNEKRAREAQERALQSQMAGEKTAREMLEKLVADRLDRGRAEGDMEQAFVVELVARERAEREKLFSMLREEMSTGTRKLDSLVMSEVSGRDKQFSMRQDTQRMEQVVRELVVKEQDVVKGKVQELQSNVHMLDDLLRRETEERCQEATRIWDAIDNHTHDLTAQVIPDSAAGFVTTATSTEQGFAGKRTLVMPATTTIIPAPVPTAAPPASTAVMPPRMPVYQSWPGQVAAPRLAGAELGSGGLWVGGSPLPPPPALPGMQLAQSVRTMDLGSAGLLGTQLRMGRPGSASFPHMTASGSTGNAVVPGRVRSSGTP